MNGEAPKKKKTWLWVVLGVFVLFGFIAIGGIFVAVSFFRQNLQITESISDTSATSEFDAVRAKFPGQKPFVELRDGRPQLVVGEATRINPQPLTSLHVIAFDEDEGKLARFTLPFWLLRMKSGPIRLGAYTQGWDDRGVSFRVEDLEKHGPGIVVDVTRPRDGRMLVWVE